MPESAAKSQKSNRASTGTSRSKAPAPKRNESSILSYVLDTNVLLHDPSSLFAFKEHTVIIPLVVLEELDGHKKGVADLARTARQVTRMLGELLGAHKLKEGAALEDLSFPLEAASHGKASGVLKFVRVPQLKDMDGQSFNASGFDYAKADNKILATAASLGARARLVTKDINLRVKALALGIIAEDYRSDHVMKDSDILPSGFAEVDADYWNAHVPAKSPTLVRAGENYIKVKDPSLVINTFLIHPNSRKQAVAWRVEATNNGITELRGIRLDRQNEYLHARSAEQAAALDLLHDTDVDFVALLGQAGSGKTLLAVAAGLQQVIVDQTYDKVLVTRATVPLGEEIGFLPGSEEDKMNAWLGGTMEDCVQVLSDKVTDKALQDALKISSMSFMRGRSFHKQYILIDEAQNLTIKQMKALLTRAGNGTKIVVTGNLAQIDTPYLDAASSGLSWAVKALSGWAHGGCLILPRGERSRLAALVESKSSQ